jgi:hypothetical protein
MFKIIIFIQIIRVIISYRSTYLIIDVDKIGIIVFIQHSLDI